MTEVETLSLVSDENARKLQELHTQKLSELEGQVIQHYISRVQTDV